MAQINSFSASSIAGSVWQNATRTLTADPATDAGAATLVWTHAARTLTADPATDAGAATLVWTHAARTLTADPATDAGAATLVWTHAARTLTADPATDAGAATLVWTHATRNLTTLANQLTAIGTTTTLAAAAVLDLRPSAGKFRLVTAFNQQQNASFLTGSYDGTTFTGMPLTDVAAAMFGGSSFGPAMKNNSGGALTYIYMGFDIS